MAACCSGALAASLGGACSAPTASGLSLASFGSLAPRRLSAHLPDVRGGVLLSYAAAFEVELDGSVTRGGGTREVRIATAGTADALLVWFCVRFDGGAEVATGPRDGPRPHWRQTMYGLASPLALAGGARLAITARFELDRLQVTAQRVES